METVYTIFRKRNVEKICFMAKGTKTGGRVGGTPNRLTRELRTALKNILADEIAALPKTLKTLTAKDRLELTIKLMHFVIPKVDSVHYSENEPNNFFDE
jgi:hypothetical protein